MVNRTCFVILHFMTLLMVQSYLNNFATYAAILNITTDQYALLAFKAHISYDPHDVLTNNWSTSSTSICNWVGVTCGSKHHRVTALNLSYMGLAGTIPPHIGNLSFLVSLSIKNNSFHGSLPNELSRLYRLEFLDFTQNEFSGEIPDIGSLTKLTELYLGDNNFEGTIPSSLFSCKQLQILNLGANNFEGRVPPEIGNLTMLKKFYLWYNKLEDTIPSSLFKCQQLQYLDLRVNNFKGRVPLEIGNLTKLTKLGLAYNNFEGTLPSSLFTFKQLQILDFRNNNFKGRVPPEIGNLTMLTELFLDYNNLEGEIASEIGNLQSLEIFSIGNNGFSGPIPFEIFNISAIQVIGMTLNKLLGPLPSNTGLFLPNLKELYLGANNLSGTIPSSISNASQLIILDLTVNSFSGLIPETLGNLRLLQRLSLAVNNLIVESLQLTSLFSSLSNCIYLTNLALSETRFNDLLPNSIGNLSRSLQNLYLRDCNIKGNIPVDIGNLSSLTFLTLSTNKLVGPIPTTIGRLQMLQGLYLHGNRLKGLIPSNLCHLRSLAELSLSNNELSGYIPECLNNLTSLRGLDLGFNQLTSTFPLSLWSLTDLSVVDLSSNSLSSPLSLDIGNMKALRILKLSRNQISGHIPITIGGLNNLLNLSLEFNRLEGSIPESFGGLVSLQLLDLSGNNLSGEIPKSLEALLYLNHLNVSFNKLRGEIPTRGPFVHFSAASFKSNYALCGEARLQVPPCNGGGPRPKKATVVRILKYVLPTLGLTMLVVSLVLISKKCQKRNFKLSSDTDSISPLASWRRISHQEVLRATEGFSANNLLGKGSFGSVYSGTLLDGTNVAIKVLNLQVQGAFKSFDMECEVLRNIRHRNLVKIISVCSNMDFKAFVLEYIPSGNLEMWLYSGNRCLNMLQRLNIMIDVATALEYLHLGCSTPIVHCDLKPSNILLDEDMVGHVSDFGISKVLSDGVSLTQTMTLATIGYMAPEYGSEGIVSTRGDVYSYGILLMETFTRKKPTDDMFTGEMSLKRLVEESLSLSVIEVVDSNLLRNENDNGAMEECLSSTMGFALGCCADSPEQRIDVKLLSATLDKIKLKFLNDIRGS